MAQYYANIQGNRGEATRMGTKNSGLTGHIRGWNVGCRISMSYNEQKKCDEVWIELTSGSNGRKMGKCLGTFTADDL